MEFGSINRRKLKSEKGRRKNTFSSSNLSCISSTSTSHGRRILQLNLPLDSGIELGPNMQVLNVVNGSPAHSCGLIQVGDFIRAFKPKKMEKGEIVTLQVVYGVLEPEQRPNCPLVIEIGNKNNTSLGVALMDTPGNKIRISSIQSGSLAERCGYLKLGDVLTSVHINSQETIPCSPYYTSFQIAQILRKLASQNSSITLTIFPSNDEENELDNMRDSTLTLTDYGATLKQKKKSLLQRFRGGGGHDESPDKEEFHFLSLCLWKDRLYEDWGFSLVNYESDSEEKINDKRKTGAIVHQIRPGGPAFSAGIRPGDRIFQINERDVSKLESTMLVPILASLEEALNLVIGRSKETNDNL